MNKGRPSNRLKKKGNEKKRRGRDILPALKKVSVGTQTERRKNENPNPITGGCVNGMRLKRPAMGSVLLTERSRMSKASGLEELPEKEGDQPQGTRKT